MKKVGIITHYYLSNNFGGNLQAYALAKYICNKDGDIAEQICYDFLGKRNEKKENRNIKSIGLLLKNPINTIKNHLHICKKRIKKQSYFKEQYHKLINIFWNRKFSKRTNCIAFFNQEIIPHSSSVFNNEGISECSTNYDIFITGSDQVWAGCSNAFTLGFVDRKLKISYAASLGRNKLPHENKEFLREQLKSFNAISVRSKDDKQIVTELTDKNVETVLDPAFLLTQDDWEKVATQDTKYKKRYIFCYFLGDNKSQKRLVKQFARDNNLKIVYIAHFKDNTNEVVLNDLFFGDYKPYDVSPADFIALIRDAEYVFTDSFHALVFSMIYHKDFFAFERISKYGDMNSRLVSLLQLVDLESRFCNNDNCNIMYINNLTPICYKRCGQILEKEIQHSKDFLNRYL